MQAFIGARLLESQNAQPRAKPFEISDCQLLGFTLRVQPSGARSYYVRFFRNRRVTLGKVGSLSPEEARDRCHRVLGNVAHGRHSLHGLDGMGPTLGQFIADTYEPWARASRPRTAANTLEKLQRLFRPWLSEPLTAITLERIESWKARRFRQGVSTTTVPRDLFTLSSVLSRAVKVGKLSENLIRRADKPRIDRRPKVRFLNDAEENRLRDALSARDREFLQMRQAYNVRRQERGEDPLAVPLHFYDHLTPAVLLSINTGLRRGELLKLQWSSIDLGRRWLTVEGGTSKTRQTRHVPLNDEAISLLNHWHEQSGGRERVFAVSTGFKTAWAKLLTRADISRFRWHDLRHHFASRLVQRGVPLNTVRDLLGHSSIAMSLRYAHLAPDQRCEAVSRLNTRPILSAALALPMPPSREEIPRAALISAAASPTVSPYRA
jgi:integrase